MQYPIAALAILWSMTSLPGGVQSPDAVAPIRVETERVLLDVFVFDANGDFVEGLQPEDFEVLEAGQTRPVTNLIAVDRRVGPATRDGGGPPPDLSQRDRLVIFLDRVSTDPAEYVASIRAAANLVQNLPERSEAALFVYDGRLRLLQGFTRDRHLLAQAVAAAARALPVRPLPRPSEIMEEIASLFSERLALGFQVTDTTSLQSVVRSAVTDAVRSSNRYLALVEEQLAGFFHSANNLVDALAHVPGTKSVIFFSRGYALRQGENLSDLLRDNIEGRVANLDPSQQRSLMMQASQIPVLDHHGQMAELIGLCNARQVRFYTLDPSGLQTLLPGGQVSEKASLYQILNLPDRRLQRDSRGLSEPIDSLAALARDTNGLAFYHRNDLDAAIAEVFEHNSRFYLLGYEPSPNRKEGKFYPVRVRLLRPGKFKIDARKGYLHENRAERRARLDYVLAYPGLFREIPFEVSIASFRLPDGETTAISLEIPGTEMPLLPWQESYRAALEVAGVIFDDRANTVAQFSRPFDVFLGPEQYRDYREKSFIFYHEVRLPPGAYQLRAIVRERERNEIGGASRDFVVPVRGPSLELSDLVLTQDIRPSAPGRLGPMFVGDYRVVPEGDSSVRSDEPVYVYFQVYNLGQREGAPRGRIEFRVEDDAGSLLYTGDLPIRRFNLSQAVAVSQPLPLDQLRLPQGHYRIRVRVEDEISGQSARGEIEIQR